MRGSAARSIARLRTALRGAARPALALAGLALGAGLGACVGAGEGTLAGTARVPVCQLDGAYDLQPSFWGGHRIGRTYYVRIQNGGATPDYQDHVTLVFSDTDEIAARIATSPERDAEGRPVVTLPIGPDRAPGVLVSGSLHLQWSCGRTKSTRIGQNVGLPAVGGAITLRSIDRGNGAEGVGGAGVTTVTDAPALQIVFRDDRPIGAPAPLGFSPDTPVGEATLTGSFRFEHRRGPAAQPFP